MKKTTILVAVLVALTISSCNFPFTAVSEDSLATSVAQTVEAMENTMQQPTLPIPAATLPPVETAVPLPTATVEPTEPPIPCLFAAFVSETIPDGTKFSPGESFTKSWTLKNTGTCDWNTDYRISFKSGDQMGAADFVKISEETDPGETIKISVDMVAPDKAGKYKGYWQMETHKGVKVGQVWVQIVVE